MSTGGFDDWLERLRERDPQAAEEFFRAYAPRIIALARTRLNARIRLKIEPDDIAQSVMRTFFRRTEAGFFDLHEWTDLWSLLARITLNKCGTAAQYFGTQKRAVNREIPASNEGLRNWDLVGAEPSAEEILGIEELTTQLIEHFSGTDRIIAENLLAGFTPQEVAPKVGRSVRTVQRVRKLVMEWLGERLSDCNR